MKKQDLKVGEIYADKAVKPVRLLSMRLWTRYSPRWNEDREEIRYYPARARDRMSSGIYSKTGRLVLTGDIEVMKSVTIPDWFDSPAAYKGAHDKSYVDSMMDFLKTLPEGVRLNVQNTSQWIGPYDEAKQAHDDERKELQRLREESEEVERSWQKRALRVEARLSDMGIEHGGLGYSRASNDERVYMARPSNFKLNIEAIEKLLDMATKEK